MCSPHLQMQSGDGCEDSSFHFLTCSVFQGYLWEFKTLFPIFLPLGTSYPISDNICIFLLFLLHHLVLLYFLLGIAPASMVVANSSFFPLYLPWRDLVIIHAHAVLLDTANKLQKGLICYSSPSRVDLRKPSSRTIGK